jgi:hypothetical protein
MYTERLIMRQWFMTRVRPRALPCEDCLVPAPDSKAEVKEGFCEQGEELPRRMGVMVSRERTDEGEARTRSE